MPAYREGPPPRAVARSKRARKKDTARVKAAVHAGAFKTAGGQAGKQVHAPPRTVRATNSQGKLTRVAATGGPVKQAGAAAVKALAAANNQTQALGAQAAGLAAQFRGHPGTLDLGTFPYTNPQQAVKARFEGYASRLWDRVKTKYGLPADARMPKLQVMSDKEARDTFGHDIDPGTYSAAITDNWWQKPGERVVKVTPAVLLDSSSRTNPPRAGKTAWDNRDFAHSLLLHEWAHTQQKVRLGQRLSEGGAEAFSQDVAPSVHTREPKGVTEYDRYVTMARRKGAHFVHDTQFKHAPHPLTSQLVSLIDELRASGQSYDQVVAGLAHHGVPAGDVESELQRYKRVTDQHGRPRDQINPGDPHTYNPRV